MANYVMLDNYNGLSCCYSFLKRKSILLKKKEVDKIRQFDKENHRCFYPFNDGAHIDSIIDFDEFDLSKSLLETSSDSTISETRSLLNFEEIRDLYLLVYPDVIFSKGERQSVIYNISESKLFNAPNSLLEYISLQYGRTIGEVVDSFSKEEGGILSLYIAFLVSNKLARIVSDINQFGTKEQYMKRYKERLESFTSVIDSAIIDITNTSSYNVQTLIGDLTAIKCGKILLRFFESNISMFFDALVGIRSSNTIVRFDLYAPKEMYLHIKDVLVNEPKLFNVFIFRCEESSLFFVNQNIIDLRKTFYLSTTAFLSPLDCGKITFSRTALIPNNDFILRSHFVNSCLYKKISIDSRGFIRNCPSMKLHFGHIGNTKLQDVVKKTDYKKPWYITKDQVRKCCKCQYRYSCFDCRAYTEDGTLYGCPSKCHFSHTSNSWRDNGDLHLGKIRK